MAPTITALDCGRLRQQERVLLAGGSRDVIEIPVPSWLVRHPAGTVVFDTGLHPSLTADSESLGTMARLFEPIIAVGGTVGPRLIEHDVDPTSALTVVLSHCHFDHAGGLCELPNARVLVQVAEWNAALDGLDAGYAPDTYDLGHEIVTIDGPHDIFGDGAIVCLPTPGHTCGHQSLRVHTADGPVILAADACYFSSTLVDDVLPPFSFDFDQQRASLGLLRREQAAGTRIIPGHDGAVFRQWL